MGACNTPLKRLFQDLSSGILKAPKLLKLQLVKKICSCYLTADQGGQKNRNEKRLRFFFTMFSTREKVVSS